MILIYSGKSNLKYKSEPIPLIYFALFNTKLACQVEDEKNILEISSGVHITTTFEFPLIQNQSWLN